MLRYESINRIRGRMKLDKRWLVAIGLVVIAETWRIFNYQHMIAPGLELVTASTLVAAALLPRRAAIVVPLALMVGGDLILGNSPILFFTWSAFAFIGLAALVLRRFNGGRLVAAGTGAGVVASLFFFLFTNFGVWATGTMYAKSWAGLMECYAMGLPFYRTNLLGNLVAVPLFLAVAVYGPVWLNALKRHHAAVPAEL